MEYKTLENLCYKCNCKMIIHRGVRGVSENVCPQCGLKNILKVQSRRKMVIEIVAPRHQEVL